MALEKLVKMMMTMVLSRNPHSTSKVLLLQHLPKALDTTEVALTVPLNLMIMEVLLMISVPLLPEQKSGDNHLERLVEIWSTN